MKKINFKELGQAAKAGLNKNSSKILIGLGIVSLVGSTVMAVKATKKATEAIDEAKEIAAENEEEFTKLDVVKVAWKYYIPAAISTTAGIACIIGADSVNSKRNAALATAYKLTETAFTEYKNEVVKVIGEKKEKEVVDRVAEKKIRENPPKSSEIIVIGDHKTLCYDGASGRYFMFDIENLKRIVNEINYKLTSEHYISLNEFYYEIGLKPTDTGYNLGWNIEDGLLDIRFSSSLTENDEPCLVLSYNVSPRYEYRY